MLVIVGLTHPYDKQFGLYLNVMVLSILPNGLDGRGFEYC